MRKESRLLKREERGKKDNMNKKNMQTEAQESD